MRRLAVVVALLTAISCASKEVKVCRLVVWMRCKQAASLREWKSPAARACMAKCPATPSGSDPSEATMVCEAQCVDEHAGDRECHALARRECQ